MAKATLSLCLGIAKPQIGRGICSCNGRPTTLIFLPAGPVWHYPGVRCWQCDPKDSSAASHCPATTSTRLMRQTGPQAR